MLDKKYLHWYVACGLLVLSLLVSSSEYMVSLIAYMLFVPWFDKEWNKDYSHFKKSKYSVYLWFGCALCISLLVNYDSKMWLFFLTTLAMAALPEEWFFRAYLQKQLGNSLLAILISSAVFSLAHMITISWVTGLLVFVPSLVYGYIFKRTGDLVLVILLHALSNLLYKLYVHAWVDEVFLVIG